MSGLLGALYDGLGTALDHLRQRGMAARRGVKAPRRKPGASGG